MDGDIVRPHEGLVGEEVGVDEAEGLKAEGARGRDRVLVDGRPSRDFGQWRNVGGGGPSFPRSGIRGLIEGFRSHRPLRGETMIVSSENVGNMSARPPSQKNVAVSSPSNPSSLSSPPLEDHRPRKLGILSFVLNDPVAPGILLATTPQRPCQRVAEGSLHLINQTESRRQHVERRAQAFGPAGRILALVLVQYKLWA